MTVKSDSLMNLKFKIRFNSGIHMTYIIFLVAHLE